MLRVFVVATLVAGVLAGVPAPVAARSTLPCQQVAGVNDRCPLWESSYKGTAGDDGPTATVLSADGAVLFVTGYSASATVQETSTAAFDTATGQVLWRRDDAGLDTDGADLPSSIAVAPGGDLVYVVGATCATPTDSATCDAMIVAYDAATGDGAWAQVMDGPAQAFDGAQEVVATRGSGAGDAVYVVARSTDRTTSVDFLVLALDGDSGEVVWSGRFDGARRVDTASDIAVADDGSAVVVTGGTTGPTALEPTGLATVAYDAATGEQRWHRRHEAGAVQQIGASVVIAASAVYVSGETDSTPGPTPLTDYLTLAYDLRTGTPLWSSTYNGPSSLGDTPLDLNAAADAGMVFVTGMSRDAGYDFATVAYDAATGAQRWVRRYDGPGRNGDAAWSLAYDPITRLVLVAGSTYVANPIGYFVAVVAYDASTGVPSWQAIHEGPGAQRGATPVHVAASSARVYVAAQVGDLTGLDPDFAVVAYDGRR